METIQNVPVGKLGYDAESICQTQQEMEALLLYRGASIKGKERMRRLMVGLLQGRFPATVEQVASMTPEEIAAAVDALPAMPPSRFAKVAREICHGRQQAATVGA